MPSRALLTGITVLLTSALLGAACGQSGSLGVASVSVEYATEPLGSDVTQPRFAWKLAATQRDQTQSAYQIQVALDDALLGAGTPDVWDSGKVASAASIQVVYAGPTLQPRTRYHWRVRVWDPSDAPSPWSTTSHWETGRLGEAWTALWIAGPSAPDPTLQPVAHLRTSFQVTGNVTRARLYATARGLYEPRLNGARVGADELTPGWTDYSVRVAYQTYDVTSAILPGSNALGFLLGYGWYAGHVGSFGTGLYGAAPSLLAELHIDYDDGSHQVVTTDPSWRTRHGPILSADLIMGERHDAAFALPGWDASGYDDSSWATAGAAPAYTGAVVATAAPPVREMAELTPVALTQPSPGVHLFDLGQNLAGRARLQVSGPAGSEVTLRFGEVLDAGGGLYTANLRTAQQKDVFALAGGGPESLEPRFAVHGFRYVEVTGHPGVPSLSDLTALVIHADLPERGSFDTDDPMVDQLQSNIDWSLRSNSLAIPTDCPQRDERLGWTGDVQVFVPTASFNRDMAAFLGHWLEDLRDGQIPGGAFRDIAPAWPGIATLFSGSPGWADAGVLVPWELYRRYGDERQLAAHYAAMQTHLAHLQANSTGFLRPAVGYGDWLHVQDETPRDLVATAYFAKVSAVMRDIATVLGHGGDATTYDTLFQDIRAAFQTQYLLPGGRLVDETQTGYVLALAFDLVPTAERQAAAGFLVDLIDARDWHLSTGYLGTPHLLPILSETGHDWVAFRLLAQDTQPSWGQMIARGATTIWERWDGSTASGGFAPPGLNSFNHTALGAVGDWLYAHVGGIAPADDEPGYAHVRIRPTRGTGIDRAHTTHESPYGLVEADWEILGSDFLLAVTIPPNSRATVYVPSDPLGTVLESGIPADQAGGVISLGRDGDAAVYAVGSGSYAFEAPLPQPDPATLPICDNGLDDDGDGRLDWDGGGLALYDPGCARPDDGTETDPGLPCDDGLDDDGDGAIDTADPACSSGTPALPDPEAPRERSQCQDGIQNDPGQDALGRIDYDGGQSIFGPCTGGVCPPGVSDPDGDGVADPDPQCIGRPWHDREASGSCGLGWELAPLLFGISRGAAGRRRRSRRRAGRRRRSPG